MKEEMEQGGLNEADLLKQLDGQPHMDESNMKRWIIYPESKFSALWDLFIAV